MATPKRKSTQKPAKKKSTQRPAPKPKAKRICPGCGATAVVPIVWGFPAPETFERERAGEVALGGCCVGPDDPAWHCKACGNDFGRSTTSQAIRREAGR